MARCGRCGLWSKYPDNHHEKKYAGVCLWYQHRLVDSEVFESRECDDFFESIPEVRAIEQLEYKVKRDNLGDAYITARFSKRLAIMGAIISVISFLVSMWQVFS